MAWAVTRRRGVVTALLLACAIIALAGAAWYSRAPGAATSSAAASPKPHRLTGARDEPHREFTPDRQLARIQHKDGSGLSPLEELRTPQGLVTIQRTFSGDGKLLEEKAFLDGAPVPVPR